ncbi:cytochrome C oxidase subunit IV family protein [Maioricimonas sp. JC845]|uniref:cytochrome C oxidase subunit IV family protein n=1 Tax=Maioricimonas sp. JC845 TaxID=3232138 RepID=UPI00345AD23D
MDSHDSHEIAHVMPLKVLFSIFGLLIFFTILTVAIAQLHLGRWEIIISMLIATTKASLVAIYFMHLRYDNPFNAMVFVFSLVFVALFLGFTLVDVEQYQPDLIPVQDPIATGS